MSDVLCRVALDAMGGDNAPQSNIKGAVEAIGLSDKLDVTLVGREDVIKKELEKYEYDEKRLHVLHAEEVIETGDPPVLSIRRKKESSIVKALNLVKQGQADAFVSAGSSGAILVGGQVIVGKIQGVERPAMAPIMPTESGISLLVDAGGNMDSRPSQLVQWAKMGSIYMENCFGIKNPRVAIVNVGLEEEKGNNLVKETFPLLKECKDINFIGSIEARNIPKGDADVIVCDAFVGNVILKLYEGTAKAMLHMLKKTFLHSFKTKMGALLVKKQLKEDFKVLDASEHGGAPLIGLNGLVVKAHGNSDAKEIHNACLQCLKFKEANITEKISATLNSNE